MDASLLLTVENLLQQKNKKNLLQTSSATIKTPSLSLSARSSPVSNKRHKFNISTASLASYSSQTNNNYASIMDSLDMDSLEDLLRKVCVRLIVTKLKREFEHSEVVPFALNARNDIVSAPAVCELGKSTCRTRDTKASAWEFQRSNRVHSNENKCF